MARPILASLLLGSILALSGCGLSAVNAPTSSSTMMQASAVVPADKAAFVKAVAGMGLKLTEAQLTMIASDRNVVPNGSWAPRPAENLTSAQNLTVHFQKHGFQFAPPCPDEATYMHQAADLAVGKRGAIQYWFDTTSFDKGYQSHVVRWNPTSHEMTALRSDGALTTYYLNFSLKATRFIQVPKF